MPFSDNLNIPGFWEWLCSVVTGFSELVSGPKYRQKEGFQDSLLINLTKEIIYHWDNKLPWQKTDGMITPFALKIGKQLLERLFVTF